MSSSLLPPLPLGNSTFETLRKANKIYVDKTAMIYELARDERKIFLSRPRRFGKTLLASTFESLFKNGLKYFKGLEIEKLWNDNGAYCVIRLDLSNLKNFATIEAFQENLNKYFISLMLREKLESPLSSQTDGLDAFISWLAVQPDESVVLLIDEYDAPLTACMDDPELFEAVRRALSGFYEAVNGSEHVLRFLFVTGIMKFGKASPFSELNNLTDISLLPKYASLLGFTHEEVNKYFDPYLDEAARTLKMCKEDLLIELTVHYAGFCFDANAQTRVFAPWSLLSFLTYPENGFSSYWICSACNPEILRQYLNTPDLQDPNDYFTDKFISFSQLSARAADPNQCKGAALLTHAGYLTIKERTDDGYLVDYPNKEVSDSLASIYREQLMSRQTLSEAGALNLTDDLRSGNINRLFEQLNRLFLVMDYKKYPITDETTCRNYIQLFLTLGAGIRAYSELHNALGQSDIEIDTERLHWVLEAKFLPSERASEVAADSLLKNALEQIQQKSYGEPNISGKKLIRIGFVFSEKERQIIKYGCV